MVETTENKTTLEMVNGLAEIADFMDDEELTAALTMVAKMVCALFLVFALTFLQKKAIYSRQ
jgi:hypothetical protein